MSKRRPQYPPEFREQMVELVRAGRKSEELAKEFEPSAQAIRSRRARRVQPPHRRLVDVGDIAYRGWMAIASSRYWSFTPTRYTVNLPFSRLGMVVGDPIFIPRNAEPEEIERWRQRVEGALNNVTRKAYAQAGADVTSAAVRRKTR